MGFFKKTISDRDWLASALPIYESALPILRRITEALKLGYRRELDSAVARALEELPSLADRLSRLPNPTSQAAQSAARNLKWSLTACLRLADELSTLSELSARGLHQMVTSHVHTGELLYSAHLKAIGATAATASELMSDAKNLFSGVARNLGLRATPT
jgi:hypothetical protein